MMTTILGGCVIGMMVYLMLVAFDAEREVREMENEEK